MRITNIGMFHTPKDWRELEAWIEKHPAHDGTRAHVLTAACMAWNLAAKITDPDFEEPPFDTTEES